MKSKWIEYQTKRILLIDLSNFHDDAEKFRAELAQGIADTRLRSHDKKTI